jgi:hypothetical protein
MKDCEVCEKPIPSRPHQDAAKARACSPHCASVLARREHSNASEPS